MRRNQRREGRVEGIGVASTECCAHGQALPRSAIKYLRVFVAGLFEHGGIRPFRQQIDEHVGGVGDQDTFDPVPTRSRWATLSSNLSFQVMDGWSHDFGPKPSKGFSRVAELVKTFTEPSARPAP